MAETTRLQDLAEPVVRRHGCELVLLTFRRERSGWTLRAMVERSGESGVDHRVCAEISRDLSAVLDAEDAIGRSYVLEVSSPGIERPLVRPADYERFRGRLASIRTRRPLEGRRRFRGTLRGLSKGRISLETEDGASVRIAPDNVDKAKLIFDSDSVGKRSGER